MAEWKEIIKEFRPGDLGQVLEEIAGDGEKNREFFLLKSKNPFLWVEIREAADEIFQFAVNETLIGKTQVDLMNIQVRDRVDAKVRGILYAQNALKDLEEGLSKNEIAELLDTLLRRIRATLTNHKKMK